MATLYQKSNYAPHRFAAFSIIHARDTFTASRFMSTSGVQWKITPSIAFWERSRDVAASCRSISAPDIGFLPPKSSARKTTLSELKNVPSTLIFYEAPQRMTETLTDMKEVLGDRDCSISRELTKKFEQTVRGKISDILALYAQDGVPKGEFVIVVAPPLEEKAGEQDVETALKQALETMSVKDAAAFVAQALNTNKKEVYTLALKLKNG